MTAPALPRPSFIARDPVEIEAELTAQFETLTGRVLQPAQVERQFIALLAYRETLLRTAIQYAAEQTLLSYAAYPMIDFLGELVGVVRLGAQSAITTLRFTLTGVLGVDQVIPAGTRVRTLDGQVIFATDVEHTIAAGGASGDVLATATTPGALGNGYVEGDATQLLDPVGAVATAENITTSAGGADQETDDRLRLRIQQAPEGFSVAGSIGAYRYHALSASGAIIDVSVSSPTPGQVRVAVLTSTGLPTDELLDVVEAALSADKVRPLTDTVIVVAPTRVTYAITATVTVLRGFDATSTLASAQAAAYALAADRRAGLGRDIVPSAIVAAMSVAGVYQVVLTLPAYRELTADEWADCTAVTVVDGGIYDG